MGIMKRLDDIEDFQDKLNRLSQATKAVEMFFSTELLKVQPDTIQVALVLGSIVEDTLYTNVTILHAVPEPKDGDLQPIITQAKERKDAIMDKFKRACPGVKQIPGTVRFI